MPFNPVRNPINVLVLDGKPSPGLCTIKNADQIREWAERGGFGQTGGFSIFKKVKLAHPVVEFKLYTAEQWDEWHEWSPMIYQLPRARVGDAGVTGGYLRCEHPILEDARITALGVEKIRSPVQSEDGVWEIVVEFIQYHRPETTLSKPEATKPKPVDPYEQQIAALRAENEALMNRLAGGR